LIEPSTLNYLYQASSLVYVRQAKPPRTMGTGPVRFAGSKGTASEAMVAESHASLGNPSVDAVKPTPGFGPSVKQRGPTEELTEHDV